MKKYLYLFSSAIFFLVFIIFTIIVKTIDVTFILTNGTYIGLSHFNYQVGNWVISLNKMQDMKVISDILFYITLAFSLVFVVAGVVEWIKGKSIKAVDKRIYLLAATYISIALIYLIFEIVKVNYSPISENGLKASYPSSHVFIGSCLILINSYTAVKMLNIASKLFKTIIYTSSSIIAVLIAFTRLLSLKHWCTDIIASILLIASIYLLFLHFYRYISEQQKRESDDSH